MPIDFLAHLQAESTRFGDVLADTDPTATVPSCPDWNAADLLWHLAEVQLFWGTIVRDRLDDPDLAEAAKSERPSDYGELLALYRRVSDELIEALANTADDVPVWTWFDADQSAGFIRRRQAHEALIHRLDAELTAGVPVTDFDPALATDGVTEVLEWMFSGVPEWGTQTVDGPIGRLATTDTGGQWLVQIGRFSGTSLNTGNVYTDDPTLSLITDGESSFSIDGNARDLDAWLWNRPTLSKITVEGDDAATFQSIIHSGVQ